MQRKIYVYHRDETAGRKVQHIVRRVHKYVIPPYIYKTIIDLPLFFATWSFRGKKKERELRIISENVRSIFITSSFVEFVNVPAVLIIKFCTQDRYSFNIHHCVPS